MKTNHFSLSIFLFLAFFVCLPPVAVSAEEDTDGRPGEKNPVTTSRQTLFRDDELMLFVGRPGALKMEYLYAVPEKDDLTSWQEYPDGHTYHSDEFGALNEDARPIASARGRTPEHGHDYAVYAFFRPDGRVSVEQYDPKRRVEDGLPGRRAKWNHFSGSTSYTRSLDVALGDLDNLSDDNGWYHDEIVLVRSTTGGNVDVDVIDGAFASLAHDHIDYDDDQTQRTSVDIGDLNGDGTLEIVVGILEGESDYWLVVYNFSNKDNSPELVKASTYKRLTNYGGGFDLAVGDFDGDGKAEVFVATGEAGNNVDLFRADDDLNLQHKHNQLNGNSGTRDTLRVVSGLFKFDADPAKGWPLNRRQVAVCFEYYRDNCITCSLYEVVKSLTELIPIGGEHYWCVTASDWGESCPSFTLNCPTYGIASLDIAAGNFVGHGMDEKQTSPLMDLAVSSVETKTGNPGKLRPAMRVLSIRSGSLENKWSWGGTKYDYDDDDDLGLWQLATTVTAADGDGDTYRLGPPAHIVVDNVLRIDRIIQEPPKHVDYLPIDYNDPDGEWDVINVSGITEFAVSLHDESSKTLETETVSTSSWEIGGSESADAKSTVTAGDMDIAGAEASIEVKEKVGYDYKENETSYNSDYHSQSYTEDTSTANDDLVQGIVHTIDIWRYPILGYYEEDSDKPHGYQEIVMPGPYTTIDKADGKDHPDWYQPVHENHNLLSYPFHDPGDPWKPEDVGSFNIGGPDMSVVMNDHLQLHWNGTPFSLGVTWSSMAGAGSDKKYNHTLSESAEIAISYEAKAHILIGSTDQKFKGKVSFHNSNSWGGETVSKATNSKTSGFHIDIPKATVVADSQYNFQPAAYITSTGGAFKIAHAIGSPQQDWWRGQYGRKADPALNLPNRFTYHSPDPAHENTDWWTLTTDASRHEMRGFFLRELVPLEEDPDTQKPPLLSSLIVDGDVVQLCARVYNYSLGEYTGNFPVRFSYYPWDIEEARQIADPVSNPSMVTSANLDALNTGGGTPMKEYCVDWDTTGLSTKYTYNDAYVNTFRFQVMLDEDDAVVEIHELYDDKGNEVFGSNNIGTYPWMNAVIVSQKPTESQDSVDLDQNDLRIAEDSMTIKTALGMVRTDDKGGPLQLELGKSYEIRALVQADQDHPFHRFVFLYDGDPDGKDKGERKGHPAGKGKGNPGGKGKVLGSSRLYGIEAESQYVWMRWTPDTLGKQEIWMRLLEDRDEVNKGNASDSLDVIVVPAKKERKQPKKTK